MNNIATNISAQVLLSACFRFWGVSTQRLPIILIGCQTLLRPYISGYYVPYLLIFSAFILNLFTIDQRPASISCKGQVGKYFRFSEPYNLDYNYSPLLSWHEATPDKALEVCAPIKPHSQNRRQARFESQALVCQPRLWDKHRM